MQYAQYDDHYVLRLDEGEEAVSTIRSFLTEVSILAGYFVAWGAFSHLKLEYYRVVEQDFRQRTFDAQLEVASLLGNIACLNGQPTIHAHLTVGDEQFRSYSGHLVEGTVRPTLEVFVTPFAGELRRSWDPERRLATLELAGPDFVEADR